MHGAAACALFMAHRGCRDAGNDRRGSGEQKQKRDNAGEATHTVSICALRSNSEKPLVFRRPFQVVDDDDDHHGFLWLKFQA